MIDRDKVIIGLQCIIDGSVRCESCGYAINKHGHKRCQQECALEAVALLKEQEAKIEQLNRFVNGFSRDAVPVVRCKEETDKLARKSHKKKKKHNKDDDIKIEVSPLTEEDLEKDEELVNRLKKYGYLK